MTMRSSIEGLRATDHPGDTIRVETTSIPQEFRPFTDQEKEALIKDGAVIFNLTGKTIEDQQKAGGRFWFVPDAGDRLLKLPSIITQVAIYPDPRDFFIPNSGNKDLATQEKLAQKDGQNLRKRLGLEDDGVDVIIPNQASTLTEVIFGHLDKTTKEGKGVWLFGPDYAAVQGLGFVYARTKNPVNESGSDVAHVGHADPDNGVRVNKWDRDGGHDNLRAVRLVVAMAKKILLTKKWSGGIITET